MTASSFKMRSTRAVAGGKTEQQQKWCFRERERDFSLDYRAIRPSEFVGTRSKAALRGEAYAWTLVLGVFDKLREVGDLSYLGFTLYLSVL